MKSSAEPFGSIQSKAVSLLQDRFFFYPPGGLPLVVDTVETLGQRIHQAEDQGQIQTEQS